MFKYSNICYVSIHVPGTKDDVNDFDILAAISALWVTILLHLYVYKKYTCQNAVLWDNGVVIKAIDNVDAFYEIHITFYCNSTYKI